VLLPGESGQGLNASLEIGSDFVRLTAGDAELGTWSHGDCEVSPDGNGSFGMALAGERVTFTPESHAPFAEAVRVFVQPVAGMRDSADSEESTYDFDGAIDDAVVRVQKLRRPDDDILSMPVLVGIVAIALVLIVGLVVLSLMI